MISKNINNGSHGLFPSAAAAGSFLVIHLVSGLFVPDFALIRGVHKLHEMVLTLMERLALSAKPGVFLFVKILVGGPPRVGGTFFSVMHLI